MKFNRAKLERYLQERTDVLGAYIFGSAVSGDAAVNDIDILVLPAAETDIYEAYARMKTELSELLDIPEDRIDILIFDLEASDPLILYAAIEKGILLKGGEAEALGDSIERLSTYLMQNEFMIRRANWLKRERLEAYSES